MKRSLRNRQERGAALIIGLILITVASLLAITSMRGSRMQEMMTSNQNNKLISQMAAEAGASELFEWASSLTATQWMSWRNGDLLWDTNRIPTEDGGSPFIGNFGFFWIDPSELTWVVSPNAQVTAQVNGAARRDDVPESLAITRISVVLEAPSAVANAGVSPFEDGVVGCSGINMTGSGQIDSFDSNLGGYDEWYTDISAGEARRNSLRTNVTVRTTQADATGSLSGNAPIYGDLVFTGSNLSLSGGTPVYGNVSAEGNVSANGNIQGTLTAGGNVTFGTASTQGGHVMAGGDAVVQATANPPPSIDAAGKSQWPDWWKWDPKLQALSEKYRSDVDLTIPSLINSGESCDQLELRDPKTDTPGKMFADVWNNPNTLQASEWLKSNCGTKCIDDKAKKLTLTGTGSSTSTIGVSGQQLMLRVDKELTTSGNLAGIRIEGDVTLVVDGNFDLGNNTQLQIAKDASLTLLVTGKTTLSGGSNLLGESPSFVRGDGDSKKAAVQLFSSYKDANNNQPGVFVGGANNSHVAVYAPHTAVRVVGSGEIFGSLRGRYVDIRGSGDVHFDEALDAVTYGTSGGGGQANPAAFRSMVEILP
ncbi:PilX N-terminal [Thiocapsa roseopersicina]|uniref:PilX N-terminal n=2 Tax=Thiocapsa roseopersicina TaxID=1058 RepID=A0A1H2Z4U9_THIRO|nr:PilX N-terminal [Thiocapsa roseopersicina]